ncbi:MAG: 3-methyl-2-oxobutanoate dehydrogenase subunit VorB [Candidatus Omnitrophota bacterium]|nr:3-methyl-2-oxobutanoate dehydrogenase subunit VorB [Candidatus Omnitrophota bacterium]
MKQKYLFTGNEACAEGALRAGCRFYAGYPITPQNELIAYMALHMEERGGVFIQSESELAAVNMVLGASAAGARAMTSSSSPGISLKQEGISYMAGCELPAVIVNVMRGGPGLGNISASQSDYFQATKGGGHGDYRIIVLAPSSVQEMFDLTFNAFTLADRYNTPVMVLSDGLLGQMMEPLEYDEERAPAGIVDKPWAMKGSKGNAAKSVKSLYLGDGVLEALNTKLQKKYGEIKSKEPIAELYKCDDAEIVLVGYGSVGRILMSCVDILRKEGIKAGAVRPITLWPFPCEAIKKLAEKIKRFFVVEMSAGQMVEDVMLAAEGRTKVDFYGRTGGGIPQEEDIIKEIKKVRSR